MANTDDAKCARVLDPVERVTEVIFGLLMAMTFTGTISVATGGQEEERTMMIAALGCNLAWGLADAVMYLLRSLVEHSRKRTLLASLRGGSGRRAGADRAGVALAPGGCGRYRGAGGIAATVDPPRCDGGATAPGLG